MSDVRPVSGMVRGRVIIGILGLDQHEVGALAVGRLLLRNGFEVIYLGRFNTTESMVAAAIDEDADIVGVSVHSWEFDGHIDALVERCHDEGIAVVVGGSVLTEADRRDLLRRGVDAVFLAYATEDEIVSKLDRLVRDHRSGAGGSSTTQSGSLPLAGRVIAVTGAARGLGRAYVDELIRLGAKVVANDIDADALAEMSAVSEVNRGPALVDNITLIGADVASQVGADGVVAAALESYGRLDGLVSNAGLLRSGSILRLSADDVDTVLAVHVRGTFLLTKAAGTHWREEAAAGRESGGSIVTTTSSAGLYGFRGEAIYSAAKAAVAAFTIVAADDFARFGVTVNGVAPVARTRLTAWMNKPETDCDPFDPANVAPLVAWLLGPGARDVTGRIFEVGGGRVSIANGWAPGSNVALTSRSGPAEVDDVINHLLAGAPPSRPIISANSSPT